MSIRVVFDTNVLFSAVGWGGVPGRCLGLVFENRIRGLTCVEILDELADKLTAKLAFTPDQVDAVLGSLLATFDLIVISGLMTGLQADPKDDKILECAFMGEATHVVTGDRRHLLPLNVFRTIKIVSPARLLKLLQTEVT